MAGAVDMDALREEEEVRNKKYVWEKKLVIGGRVIESKPQQRRERNRD